MMLVPDFRRASSELVARSVAACERIANRDARRFLYEEFTLGDRRELDDAILEMRGIDDAEERVDLQDRLYRDVADLQQAIRAREIIAQHDRLRSNQGAPSSAQAIAEELWIDHEASLNLLEFPEDFVTRVYEGDVFDLPQGEVEVGQAMIADEGLLRVGTVRIGGRDGEVLDVGGAYRARFLAALSMCNRTGRVRLPDDALCAAVLEGFDEYRQELEDGCFALARQRTHDQNRQRAIAMALLRKGLQWRRK